MRILGFCQVRNPLRCFRFSATVFKVAKLLETNILIVSPPDGLDFSAAGRRRSAAAVARAAEERRRDEDTAARLQAQGLEPWQGDDELTVVDLASQGEQSESRGRTLRRWPVYHATVRREQREAAAQIGAFVEDERSHDRAVKIVHLRIRPTGPVPVGQLREHHREQRRRLAAQLAYVARASGGLIVPLAWGAHHRPVDGGRLIDWHAHVALIVQPGADLPWLLSYFGGAETDSDRVWIDARDRADDPEHLACYLREGVARYVDQFDSDALAEYVEQVAGLHRYQTVGPLREHVGRVRAAGLQARRDPDDGRVVLAPPPRRPAHRPVWRTAGPAVLCVRLAWIGGELRPAVLVRGWRGWWSEIAGRYDLDGAVSAARAALAARSSTSTADNPESTTTRSASTSTQQQLTSQEPQP